MWSVNVTIPNEKWSCECPISLYFEHCTGLCLHCRYLRTCQHLGLILWSDMCTFFVNFVHAQSLDHDLLFVFVDFGRCSQTRRKHSFHEKINIKILRVLWSRYACCLGIWRSRATYTCGSDDLKKEQWHLLCPDYTLEVGVPCNLNLRVLKWTTIVL